MEALGDTPQSSPLQLRCISGGEGDLPDARAAMGAWGSLGEALWPAWSRMLGSEISVYDALGEEVGEKLLVLWAISRFKDSAVGGMALAELVDESGRPRFGDPLVEDMMLAAFALGAAWAGGPDMPVAPVPGPKGARLRLATPAASPG